jgi:anti-repressor protein
MTALDIFTYAGQQIRTVVSDGEPWFLVSDVCDYFGVTNRNRAMQEIDPSDKGGTQIDTPGGRQTVATVNEPGLFDLLFALQPQKARGIDQSVIDNRITQLRAFKRWVTHEVLPSIRKTGQFGSALPTNFAEALELAAVKVREIEALEAKAAEDAPKLEAYGRLMDSDGHYSFEAVGKMIGVGRNTLFRRLREAGIIQTGSRLPYQRYAHHFDVVATTWRDAEGTEHPTFTTKILPSGLPFILKKIGTKALMPAATTG